MSQIQRSDPRRRYVPCLEGIRGYGFLLVFCGHYFWPDRLAHPGTFRLKFLMALSPLVIIAVPAFFVLSGYLIGGILYHTRNREGYFRVFYTRRVLRVFPVYYLTLLAIGCFYAVHAVSLNYHFWTQFLYIQNLLPGFPSSPDASVDMGHFWSLAVEEQFYLLCPLVMWLFPDRRKLIGIAISLVALSCGLRFAAPLLSLPTKAVLFFTPTRADAIILGVLLALIREDAIYDRIEPLAKWIALTGLATVVLLYVWEGQDWSKTYLGENIWIPLVNVIAAAIVIAVMEEKSFMNRACSQRWVCWLGSLSYSAYVFHLTFSPFFLNAVTARLSLHMRQSFAVLTSGAFAFTVTLLLSILSHRFIERPIMNLKQRIQYGAAKPFAVSQGVGERVLVSAGD